MVSRATLDEIPALRFNLQAPLCPQIRDSEGERRLESLTSSSGRVAWANTVRSAHLKVTLCRFSAGRHGFAPAVCFLTKGSLWWVVRLIGLIKPFKGSGPEVHRFKYRGTRGERPSGLCWRASHAEQFPATERQARWQLWEEVLSP